MKQLIGTVLAAAFVAVVVGFWVAPGWMDKTITHAVGLPSAEDRNLGHQVNTIILRDMAARSANCPKVKSWGAQRMDGKDIVTSFTCTSGEAYEVRMSKDRDWTYRRI